MQYLLPSVQDSGMTLDQMALAMNNDPAFQAYVAEAQRKEQERLAAEQAALAMRQGPTDAQGNPSWRTGAKGQLEQSYQQNPESPVTYAPVGPNDYAAPALRNSPAYAKQKAQWDAAQAYLPPDPNSFQGVGNYRNPAEFARANPEGFRNANPHLAQAMDDPQRGLRTMVQTGLMSPEEATKLAQLEATRGNRPSVFDILKMTGGDLQKARPAFDAMAREQGLAAQMADAENKRLKDRLDVAGKVKGLQGEPGTWQPIEAEGKQWLVNNKTGQIKPMLLPGAQQPQPGQQTPQFPSMQQMPQGQPVSMPGQANAKVSPADKKAALELSDQMKGKRNASDVVVSMMQDYGRLNQLGATVDPSKGVAENLWARAQTSGPGQFIAGAVGTEAQSVIDNINMSRPMLISNIAKAAGISATQLNSNAELQFYLQAATDPTAGYQANLSALKRIDQTFGSNLVERLQAGTKQGQQQPAVDPSRAQAPQAPQAPNGQAQAQLVFEAQKAINAGANPEAVRQRLQSMGVDPRKVGM